MKHKWAESFRDLHRTVRVCERCGMVKISRHESEGGRDTHWWEFYRGSERFAGDGTPACEPTKVDA